MRRLLADRSARLAGLDKLLNSLSYERVLDRGFAVILDEAGTIIRAPSQVRPGEPLTARLAEGDVAVSASGAPARRARKARTPPTDNGQSSLF